MARGPSVGARTRRVLLLVLSVSMLSGGAGYFLNGSASSVLFAFGLATPPFDFSPPTEQPTSASYDDWLRYFESGPQRQGTRTIDLSVEGDSLVVNIDLRLPREHPAVQAVQRGEATNSDSLLLTAILSVSSPSGYPYFDYEDAVVDVSPGEPMATVTVKGRTELTYLSAVSLLLWDGLDAQGVEPFNSTDVNVVHPAWRLSVTDGPPPERQDADEAHFSNIGARDPLLEIRLLAREGNVAYRPPPLRSRTLQGLIADLAWLDPFIDLRLLMAALPLAAALVLERRLLLGTAAESDRTSALLRAALLVPMAGGLTLLLLAAWDALPQLLSWLAHQGPDFGEGSSAFIGAAHEVGVYRSGWLPLLVVGAVVYWPAAAQAAIGPQVLRLRSAVLWPVLLIAAVTMAAIVRPPATIVNPSLGVRIISASALALCLLAVHALLLRRVLVDRSISLAGPAARAVLWTGVVLLLADASRYATGTTTRWVQGVTTVLACVILARTTIALFGLLLLIVARRPWTLGRSRLAVVALTATLVPIGLNLAGLLSSVEALTELILAALLTLLLARLYHLSAAPDGGEGAARRVGLLLAVTFFFDPRETWMFLPVMAAVGLAMTLVLLLPKRPSPVVAAEDDQRDLQRVPRRMGLARFRPEREKKRTEVQAPARLERDDAVQAALALKRSERALATLGSTPAAEVLRDQGELATFESRMTRLRDDIEVKRGRLSDFGGAPDWTRIFSDGPTTSPWVNGLIGATYSAVLASPWMLLTLAEVAASTTLDSNFVALGLLSPLLAAGRWVIYGFFFGYFYPLIRGKTGLGKGTALAVALAVPAFVHGALEASTGVAQWEATLLWIPQIVLHCLLLGLLAGDFETLRRAGQGWLQLVELHNLRSLITWASALVVAVGAAARTLITEELSALITGWLP